MKGTLGMKYLIGMIATALALGGCASWKPIPVEAEGRLRAQVLDIVGSKDSLGPVAKDCRQYGDRNSGQFALVVVEELTGVPKTRNKWIVPIKQGQTLKVGNLVYVSGCLDALLVE